MKKLFLCVSAGLALGACSDPFTPYQELASLRVLAMRSDPVWPAANEPSVLSALVFSPDSLAVSYEWSWCPIVGPASEGYPCMVSRADLEKLLTDAGASITDVPDYDLGTAETATFQHAVPGFLLAAICAGIDAQTPPAVSYSCDNGMPVTLRLRVSNGVQDLTATKTLRLRFDPDTVSNANPVVGTIRASRGGNEQTFDGGDEVLLKRDKDYDLQLNGGVLGETFVNAAGDPEEETLLLSWFSTSGGIKSARTRHIPGDTQLSEATANTFTPPLVGDFDGDTTTLYVVVRDSRDGVGWTSGSATLVEQ